MKVYLCGPMSGIPDYNYPAFHKAEAELVAMGYEVLNPTRNIEGHPEIFELNPTELWQWCMRRSIQQLMQADVVCLLPLPSPDWYSKGMDKEIELAVLVGMSIFSLKAFPIDNIISLLPTT